MEFGSPSRHCHLGDQEARYLEGLEDVGVAFSADPLVHPCGIKLCPQLYALVATPPAQGNHLWRLYPSSPNSLSEALAVAKEAPALATMVVAGEEVVQMVKPLRVVEAPWVLRQTSAMVENQMWQWKQAAPLGTLVLHSAGEQLGPGVHGWAAATASHCRWGQCCRPRHSAAPVRTCEHWAYSEEAGLAEQAHVGREIVRIALSHQNQTACASAWG